MTDTKGPEFSPVTESKSIGMGDVEDVPSQDRDVAAAYANQFEGENAYTRKEWTRLRWKLDLRLVPLLWFNVTLGAMDKVTTATAALYGFRADTGLTGNRYSWVGSAFYVSQNLLLAPSKLLTANTVRLSDLVSTCGVFAAEVSDRQIDVCCSIAVGHSTHWHWFCQQLPYTDRSSRSTWCTRSTNRTRQLPGARHVVLATGAAHPYWTHVHGTLGLLYGSDRLGHWFPRW